MTVSRVLVSAVATNLIHAQVQAFENAINAVVRECLPDRTSYQLVRSSERGSAKVTFEVYREGSFNPPGLQTLVQRITDVFVAVGGKVDADRVEWSNALMDLHYAGAPGAKLPEFRSVPTEQQLRGLSPTPVKKPEIVSGLRACASAPSLFHDSRLPRSPIERV